MPSCRCTSSSIVFVVQLDLRETVSGDSSMFRTATTYASPNMISLEMQQLTVHSTRPELHHGNRRISHSRAIDDMGFLWYVYPMLCMYTHGLIPLDYSNNHGNNALAKFLMIIVAILNAGRNSFSFFLLLIVCMGYGVVKPSLGKTMWYVRALWSHICCGEFDDHA